jgi:hypothetical protein
MDPIPTNKFEMITMCCGMLVIFSSCLYILAVRNQRSVIIGTFLNIGGFLMFISALTGKQSVEVLWLLLISVLSVIVIWAGVIHLYYRKAGGQN